MYLYLRKHKELLLVIAFAIIYFLRILYLDIDVKCFDLAQIQPIDGVYYNEIAIGISKYGFLNSLNDGFNYITLANSKTYLIPSLLVALSIRIFGNNYYGLFIAYVLMGAVVLFLLYKVLNKYLKKKLLVFFGCLFYLVDFNILMLSRCASTPIPCMLITMLVLYFYTYINRIDIKYFLIGFFSILSFCYFYMYMPFLILGIGFTVLIDLFFEKNKMRIMSFYVLGIITSLTICECISLLFYKQHIVYTILDTLTAHGSKIGGAGVFSSIRHLFGLCIHYWSANQFRYNYLSLALSLLSICYGLYSFIFKKDNKIIILISIIFMHYFQTIFLDNMTPSKSTITYPLFIILICYMIDGIKFERKSIALLVFVDLVLSVSLLLYYFSKPLVLVDYKLYFYIIVAITLLSINISVYKSNFRFLLFPACVTIIFMISASYFYVYRNMSYIDRGIMIDIGNLTNNGIIINGKGWNLYNNVFSPSDGYDHYKGVRFNESTVIEDIKKACEKYNDLYYIGYKDDYKNTNEKIKDTPYEFESVKVYNRNYTEFFNSGRKFDIELSKKKFK